MKAYFSDISDNVSEFVEFLLQDEKTTNGIRYLFYAYTGIQLLNFVLVLLGFTFHYENFGPLYVDTICIDLFIYPLIVMTIALGLACVYFVCVGICTAVKFLLEDVVRNIKKSKS